MLSTKRKKRFKLMLFPVGTFVLKLNQTYVPFDYSQHFSCYSTNFMMTFKFGFNRALQPFNYK